MNDVGKVLRQLGGAGLVLAIAAVCPAEKRPHGAEAAKPTAAPAAAEEDPLGPNGACYVCHMTFVKEELAKSHLAHHVGCVKCHGLSAKHANDENIGATKPDILYRRERIDAACSECHEEHDVPARKVIARFLERKLPARGSTVCTDCHGQHKIDRSQLH